MKQATELYAVWFPNEHPSGSVTWVDSSHSSGLFISLEAIKAYYLETVRYTQQIKASDVSIEFHGWNAKFHKDMFWKYQQYPDYWMVINVVGKKQEIFQIWRLGINADNQQF